MVTISNITLCMFIRKMFVQPVALMRTIQNECSNCISLLGSTSCCYFIANMLGVVKFIQSSSWDWLVGAQLHIGHFIQMLVFIGSYLMTSHMHTDFSYDYHFLTQALVLTICWFGVRGVTAILANEMGLSKIVQVHNFVFKEWK